MSKYRDSTRAYKIPKLRFSSNINLLSSFLLTRFALIGSLKKFFLFSCKSCHTIFYTNLELFLRTSYLPTAKMAAKRT